MFYRALDGTNTKTRRLAYLTTILVKLERSGLTEQQLLRALAEWNSRNKHWLANYWVKTGEVTFTRRNSAGARYIQLASDIGLISPIAGLLRATRIGLVLSSLRPETMVRSSGPFYLSPVEQAFYLFRLLEKDADILLTVIDYLSAYPGVELAQVQREFKTSFIARLNQKMIASNDVRTQQSLRGRRQEVEKWRQPEKYAEHIVPPRLNWLLDLKLLEEGSFRHHKYHFNQSGRNLVAALPVLNGHMFHEISTDWLQSEFWYFVIHLVYAHQKKRWNELDERGREDSMSPVMPAIFTAFQYTSIPKVSLTQALLFACIKLATEQGIGVGPSELATWLSNAGSIAGRRYQVRISARENESYLIRQTDEIPS